MKKIIFSLLSALILFSCSSDDDALSDFETSFFTDNRDGQTYQIVKIGNQTWFAENLNYTPQNSSDSSCYNNQDSNCFVYGRLYNPDEAKVVCPEGYHLPSENEWIVLFDYLGGINVAQYFLKPNAEQLGRKINFNLLASGFRSSTSYLNISEVGYYWMQWTSIPKAVRFEPEENVDIVTTVFNRGQSCRCIKD